MDGTTGDSEPRIDASDLLQDVVSVSSTSGLETDLQDSQADAKESEASVQHDGDFGVYTPSGPNLEHDSHCEPDLPDAVLDADREVTRAWTSLTAKPTKFFWEQDFWDDVMSRNLGAVDTLVSTSLSRPQVYTEIGVEQSQQSAEQPLPKRPAYSTFHHVVKDVPPETWMEERDAYWERSIRRWCSLVESWSESETVVCEIKKRVGFQSKAQILVDIFYNKAPSTLFKRVNSLGRLTNYLLKAGSFFPCNESQLYEFLCKERDLGAPASRLKATIEAIVFCRHVLGIEALDQCISSRRCAGAASSQKPHVLKQAPPFSVEHLKVFHYVLFNGKETWDSIFSGMVLFCVYARARWSDAQHCEKLFLDCDYNGKAIFLEGSTRFHKTAKTLQLKHTFLPLVAPAMGVDSVEWCTRWMNLREVMGVENLAKFPLMPAPDCEGRPTVRALSTDEASKWMNMIVERFFPPAPDRYTTHSCKATCLSFLAKAGCSFEDRLVLGYHANPLRMALTYSRDGSSRPLKVLEDCLAMVRDGAFRPDETRSGRFVSGQEPAVPPLVEVIKSEAEEEVEAEAYVTTCTESESGEDDVVLPAKRNFDFVTPEGTDPWKHRKWKTLHLSMRGNTQVFLCGRKIGEAYDMAERRQRFDMVKCRRCFQSKAL